MWAGPVANWLRACHRIIELGPEGRFRAGATVRSPISMADPHECSDYLRYIEVEARKRYDAGMTVHEAAFDIKLGDFESWGDNERIAINVDTLFREFSGSTEPPKTVELFGLMENLKRRG
ncbi:MAG: hypothetical protein U5O39_14645 [Gammaproteobacteria bacterium]|nr:hypothetical protein [Gammaproteobacteria bacterium]